MDVPWKHPEPELGLQLTGTRPLAEGVSLEHAPCSSDLAHWPLAPRPSPPVEEPAFRWRWALLPDMCLGLVTPTWECDRGPSFPEARLSILGLALSGRMLKSQGDLR